ncbi:MAG: DUF3108 domain-containing protein [Alistipes sp.]
MKKHILALCAVLIAATVSAQLYHAGEVLRYKVAYRAKLIPNTEMATVVMATTLDTLGGRTVYKVFGEGKIMPSYRWFFNIDDKYTIYVDTLSKRTVRFESDIFEGGYTFRSHYTYDWRAMQVQTWSQSRSKEPKQHTLALTEQSMDPVSLYFNLRSVDASLFTDDTPRELEMVLENKIRRLRYRFLGREVCKVPKKGKFRTLKFACTLGSSEEFSFTDGSEFFIWITDDDNHFPVMLSSPIRVGSVRAYISGWEGLKYPLASRVQ